MPASAPLLVKKPVTKTIALGVVSFLNARPLRDLLSAADEVVLRPDVPSRLGKMLDHGECDLALLPVVDGWRRRETLELVSDACIASDGETLTVRVYSKTPPDQISRLHVDGDSHTSIALARVLWQEMYGRRLETIAWNPAMTANDDTAPIESILLIGDKVVRQAPRGYGFEVDLGAAWKHLTGLPFVFAAWYGRRGEDHAHIARILSAARDAGVAGAVRIARSAAALHGWPVPVAERYLCDIMKYTLTPPMRAAMDRFFALAAKHGLLE